MYQSMERTGDSGIMRAGKTAQLQEMPDFLITDEQLDNFLDVNFKHLGIKRRENQDEDVSLISWYTQKKLLVAIQLFTSFGMTNLDNPIVIPYILNIVNENSERIPSQPSNFKGTLYPPQSALLKRMIDVEAAPLKLTAKTSNITMYGGLLNERLSFGKTFCIPALLCEKFTPYESDKPNLIPTNLIVCGTKVAKEWKKNLNTFTSFNFQVVELANHLNTLETVIANGKYPDVLVVKDGDITWNGKKDKALNHVISIISGAEPKCFLRVIYDDYDMLKLEAKSEVPDALFTWFVSGTDSNWSAPNINFWCDNNGKRQINGMASSRIIMDAIASIKCNREYSVTEYNIPQIDSYDATYEVELTEEGEFVDPEVQTKNMLKLVQTIVNNESIECEQSIFTDTSLLDGVKNIPYQYDRKTMKILVAIENKKDQEKLIALLNTNNIKTVKLSRANVDKFAREDATVCVAGNLFGINMGFLTHIVINDEFDINERTQIIGRGQRLSRTQNLQVYFTAPNY